MNPDASAEGRPWCAIRWFVLIALVFGLQLALLFGLSDRPPAPKPAQAPVPILRLAGNSWGQFLALHDPTWFALPHRQGFSGLAWMNLRRLDQTNGQRPDPVDFHPFTYSAPPEWLRLPNQQPGLLFSEFVGTNHFAPAQAVAGSQLALTLPEVLPLPLSPQRSELRVQGELAARPLVSQFELKSWQSSSLLTNSVVQVAVSATGWPQRAALLKSSGLAEADQDALARAALARFAPLPEANSQPAGTPERALTPGLLVFEWHTLPVASTSPAPSAP